MTRQHITFVYNFWQMIALFYCETSSVTQIDEWCKRIQAYLYQRTIFWTFRPYANVCLCFCDQKKRSSAIAERPRDASCHWIFS